MLNILLSLITSLIVVLIILKLVSPETSIVYRRPVLYVFIELKLRHSHKIPSRSDKNICKNLQIGPKI